MKQNNFEPDYKDYELFKFDFKDLELESVESEDDALSILLGVNVVQLLRFDALETRHRSEKKRPSKNSKVWKKLITPDEKFFYTGYMSFLEEYYPGFRYAEVLGAYNEAKKRHLWKKDFKEYAQNLYDAGFIFKRDVVEELAKKGIKFEYSEGAWSVQFFKYWLGQGGVTLSEGISIFKGQSPIEGERSFQDLSQNPCLLSCDPSSRLFWNLFKEDFEDLGRLFSRHVSVQKIIGYQGDGKEKETLFRPEDIMLWLMKNTLHIPPKALLEVLGIDENDEEKAKRASENTKASRKATQPKERRSELHQLIGEVIKEFKDDGKEITAQKVLTHIKTTFREYSEGKHAERHEYACLVDVTDTVITWKSYREYIQTMSRRTFNNVITEYRTGKKQSIHN